MGVLYLFQEREILSRSPRRFYYLIPSLERSDTIGARSVVGGFGFLTLAMITGFLWNHSLHGRYWTGDPKEWASLVAWVIYVVILAARWRGGWGGRRAAWLAIAGLRDDRLHVRLGDARARRGGGSAMIVVVGLNHETAPVAVREALAFPKERLPDALDARARGGGARRGHDPLDLQPGRGVRARGRCVARRRSRRSSRAFTAALPRRSRRISIASRAEAAVRHAFRVAASLDSMVMGEPQILGQVKDAYASAEKAGSLGSVLNALRNRSICRREARAERDRASGATRCRCRTSRSSSRARSSASCATAPCCSSARGR